MDRVKIGLKYCGNCNPTIDGPALVREILKRMPEVICVSPENFDCALCLVVSGCRRDCASREGLGEKNVTLAGASVDNEEYSLDELAAETVRRIKRLLGPV